ncbi:ABC transporter substrate-binding protein [Thalassotalea fusca]
MKINHKASWLKQCVQYCLAGAVALSSVVVSAEPLDIESKSLDTLYQDALKEGGKLVVWAGGDKPDQQYHIESLFKKRFPKMDIEILVDLSKYHNAKVDYALATGGKLPDIIQLQTLHDFDYWKEQGVLLPYKPRDWDKVYPVFRDPDGTWTGVYGITFTNLYNASMVSGKDVPRDALDYLDPKFKGKIVLTYPHDDDAVLYQFERLIAQYGWDYIHKLIEQDPVWVRGTAMPYVAVAAAKYPVSFTTFWPFVDRWGMPDVKVAFPENDSFLTWVQNAAILKGAENPAAAKLYMSWILSKEFQEDWLQFPVRVDVEADGGKKTLFHHNTDPEDFRKFMRDRARVERLRAQFEQLIGPAAGPSPLDMDYNKIP